MYGTYACTSQNIFSPDGFVKYGDLKAGQVKENPWTMQRRPMERTAGVGSMT